MMLAIISLIACGFQLRGSIEANFDSISINGGSAGFVKQLKKRKSVIPIGVSIGKNFDTPINKAYEDYIFCLKKAYPVADYISINISSPNTKDLRKLESKEYFSDLITVLDSQKRMFDTKGQMIAVRKMLIENRIDLLICLGGRFSES